MQGATPLDRIRRRTVLAAVTVAAFMLLAVLTLQWVAARSVLGTEEPLEALLVG